jgi:leucyl-tRNA synthetase
MKVTKDITLELGRCPLKRSTIKKVAKDVLDVEYDRTDWTLTKTLYNLWEIHILKCGAKADFSCAESSIKIELARLTRLYWDLKIIGE